MATFMNGFRDSALPQIIGAIQRLQDDPERLAQERRQYSDSPPPYTSGETTKPPSPAPPLSKADRRIQRQHDRLQSVPYWQYMYQWRREEDRIIEQIERRKERRKETLPYSRKLDYATNAKNNIKNNWIEQGIWNDKWTGYPLGRWKHEGPVKDEIEAQPEPGPPFTGLFGPASPPRQPTPPPKISEEQLAVREREAAASRPLPQFRYQVSKEREWLEDEFWHEEFTGLIDVDVIAHENVKNSWIEQKIWNLKWGDEPGMVWMHEEPDEEPDKEELDIDPAPGAVSTEETYVAESTKHALRPIFEPAVLGLPPAQLSDGDRVSSNTSSASRGNNIPSTLNQHTTASNPLFIDVEITQPPAESAARILRRVRSSKIRKRGQTKPLAAKASPAKIGQGSGGVKDVLMPTKDMPTLSRMDALVAGVSLVASKPVRRKRESEVELDARERSLLLPRRSARIKERIGTSRCTVYDRDDASASGSDLRRGRHRSTRLDRHMNPNASANPHTPRRVLKTRFRRQVTQLSEGSQTQPGQSRRGRPRRKHK